MQEKEFVMYLADTKRWVSADGKEQAIEGMNSNHIRNCMRLLERKGYPGAPILIDVFQKELNRRGDDVPASMEMEDRYRRLCGIARDMHGILKLSDPVRAMKYGDLLKSVGVDV